jgi:polyisoprenoid-binding protein YceI
MPSRRPRGRRSRRYRRWRGVVIAVAALIIVAVVAIGAFIKLQPTPAPLMLPRGPAAAPAGPMAGTWRVGNGSAAGFRVEVTAVGLSNYAVGRTRDVTGTIVVTGDAVTSAAFSINLSTIKVDGRAQPRVAASLDTAAHPKALVWLRWRRHD